MSVQCHNVRIKFVHLWPLCTDQIRTFLASVYESKIFNPSLFKTINIQYQNIDLYPEHIVVNYALYIDLSYF